MAQQALSQKKTADFPIWKTVKLSPCKTPDEYRKALKKGGLYIGDWGNDILGKPAFTASDTETEVDLVVVSVAELCSKKGAKYDAICARALEMGLELCPAEVGPALRLAYKDQPRGEWLIIAMNAIIRSFGDPGVFFVGRDLIWSWLHGDSNHPSRLWGSDDRFVFVRPR